ncbi:MAG: PH domain-containing protein, partial [Bifidobacteriaceae bacterium]|nr:PH domain-containing protein [Bifidobacteriaceae bacterium]
MFRSPPHRLPGRTPNAMRPVGRFALTRSVFTGIWLMGAVLAAISLLTAGQSGTRVVMGCAALGGFGLLAAHSVRLGYIATRQGLVVVGLATTRVIPWRHIERIEALPHRWSARSDVQSGDLVWVAQITYGHHQCSPLFTVRR